MFLVRGRIETAHAAALPSANANNLLKVFPINNLLPFYSRFRYPSDYTTKTRIFQGFRGRSITHSIPPDANYLLACDFSTIGYILINCDTGEFYCT